MKAPPSGPDWVHELKYDGYRIHARLERRRARLPTRTGLDWTDRYEATAEAVSAQAAYLDGELCAVRADATTSFPEMQAATDGRRTTGLAAASHLENAARTPPPRTNRFGSPLDLSHLHWVRPSLVCEVRLLPGPPTGCCGKPHTKGCERISRQRKCGAAVRSNADVGFRIITTHACPSRRRNRLRPGDVFSVGSTSP
jgi:hypothetical protein